jgi:hypothetical protein
MIMSTAALAEVLSDRSRTGQAENDARWLTAAAVGEAAALISTLDRQIERAPVPAASPAKAVEKD